MWDQILQFLLTGVTLGSTYALVALGYSEKDAAAALRKLPPDIGVSEGIKLAMKSLT